MSSYLKTHIAKRNGICTPERRRVYEVGEGSYAYMVSLPRLIQDVKCPVPGCLGVADSTGRLCKISCTATLDPSWRWSKKGWIRCPAVTCAE